MGADDDPGAGDTAESESDYLWIPAQKMDLLDRNTFVGAWASGLPDIFACDGLRWILDGKRLLFRVIGKTLSR